MKVISINEADNFCDVLGEVGDNKAVIVWKEVSPKSPEFMKGLQQWIQNGGAFVCGVTPWYWARGRSVQQIPTFRLLKVVFLFPTFY